MHKLLFLVLGLILGAGGLYAFVQWTDRLDEAPSVSQAEVASTTVGFIGCSNTRQTVYGYRWAGGSKLWKVYRETLNDYDDGSVRNWADPDALGYAGLWERLDAHLATYPNTTAVWWQLCLPRDQAEITIAEVKPVLEQIRSRIPGVTVYVSPLADYTQNVCEITGVEGIERAHSLAAELDTRHEDVLPGPTLGPLSLAEIATQEQDRCHPNEEGMGTMGAQLKTFFDSN